MLWWINYIQGHSVIRCNSKSHQQVLALLLDRDSWQDCTSRFWLIKQIASPYLQRSQRYQCNTYRLVPEKRRGYFFNFLTNWCFRFVIMHLWPGFPPDLLIHRLELSSCVYWLEGFERFCWNPCRTLSISIGKFSLLFGDESLIIPSKTGCQGVEPLGLSNSLPSFVQIPCPDVSLNQAE